MKARSTLKVRRMRALHTDSTRSKRAKQRTMLRNSQRQMKRLAVA